MQHFVLMIYNGYAVDFNRYLNCTHNSDPPSAKLGGFFFIVA